MEASNAKEEINIMTEWLTDCIYEIATFSYGNAVAKCRLGIPRREPKAPDSVTGAGNNLAMLQHVH